MTNSPMHFEVRGGDREQLARFYASLSDADGPAGPGGPKRPVAALRGWVNYVNVPSVDTALDRASKLGATILRGKSAVPHLGWFAMLVDPQGNPFALWQGDPDAT
jgi:predicted enzyme related to lactoylglutathione lyase